MIFLKTKEYNRKLSVKYAKKWALDRNSKYYNFEKIGGDCTSFVSQCIYEGCKIMNYTKNGWYYKTGNNKSPSWTGVEFLYSFLINNKTIGPYGIELNDLEKLMVGDVAQMSFDGTTYTHSLLIIKINKPINLNNIFIAAHTNDVLKKSIMEYQFKKIRFIHLEGVRSW